jgi:hypothetical protein
VVGNQTALHPATQTPDLQCSMAAVEPWEQGRYTWLIAPSGAAAEAVHHKPQPLLELLCMAAMAALVAQLDRLVRSPGAAVVGQLLETLALVALVKSSSLCSPAKEPPCQLSL